MFFPSLNVDRFFDLNKSFLNELYFQSFPKVDLLKTEKGYDFSLDLPGIEKKDVSISFEKNIITITGERKEEKVDEKNQSLIKEISYGSFKRSFSIPDHADISKTEASFENGVLKLSIPYSEKVIPETKKIEIK